MKIFMNTRNKFRLSIIIVFTIFVVILSSVFRIETVNMARKISVDYAQFYASEAEKFIQSRLMRDITLVKKAGNTQAILSWLKDENNEELKATAYNEILSFRKLLRSENISITVNQSKNYYHFTAEDGSKELMPIGTLDIRNPSDQWYFKSIQNTDEGYSLNVLEDRFIENTRIWINVRVSEDGVLLGNIGSGLELKPIMDEFLKDNQTEGIKVLLINEEGTVELDSQVDKTNAKELGNGDRSEKEICKYFPNDIYKKQVEAYLANPKEPLLLSMNESDYDFLAIRPIAGTHWHVAVFFSVNALMDRYDFKVLYGWILVVILGLGVIFTKVSSRMLMNPLEKLNESIGALKDDPDRKFYGLDRTDEYGALAKTIQNMKDQLSDYNKDLEMEVAKRSSDLEVALQKIKSSEMRLEKLFMTMPVGVFRIKSNCLLLYCNDFFKQQFEAESEEQLQQWLSKGEDVAFADNNAYQEFVEKLSELPESLNLELKLVSCMGKRFWADVRLSKVIENGDCFYDGTLINIQSQKEVEKNLINLINIDPLTGIYNRHYFDTVLIGEVNRSERYEEPLSMVIFDLDFFKRVNDTFGHDKGDEVLKRTASEVQNALRKSDILVRWGGEEFAILMPYTGKDDAAKVSEKIRETLQTLMHSGVGNVTASFGVADHLFGESTIEWFKRADTAMFNAKNAGRNCVRISEDFEPAHASFIKLIWKKEFESGDPRIDEQHKVLFQYANQIKNMSLSDNDLEKETLMFEKIIQHIVVHFQSEEEILKAYGYPELVEHHKIHEGLVAEIALARQAFEEGRLGVAEVFTFLTDVVIAGHLFHEDAKFFKYIQKQR